ncbi:hypothetical protein DMY87_10995 [Rhizobium wuzhouense]|uniref:Uncharacterized protein n=1 Tax=Rhizobium wuzhouense TaxID=1986026 RepID=A0ABX5NT43_9HYPH|nr:hypothetical protein DMY87_10995 [Rhizobium wuzhouense]
MENDIISGHRCCSLGLLQFPDHAWTEIAKRLLVGNSTIERTKVMAEIRMRTESINEHLSDMSGPFVRPCFLRQFRFRAAYVQI